MILKLGSQGPEVEALQTFLKLNVDGDFGPKTEAAVKDWQKAHGLNPDGVVGDKTYAAMGLPVTKPVSKKYVYSDDALKKYGDPHLQNNMIVWDVPTELEIGVIPKKLYCNKDLVEPLKKAFKNLIDTGYVKELKTFDGCFCIRNIKGSSSMSLHSWGIAIDVNAAWNGLGVVPVLSQGFVKCFTDVGFDWGGNFTRKDGMHFQLSKI